MANLEGDEPKHDNHRKWPNFPPTVWGYGLASFIFSEMEFKSINRQVEVLKENVKELLMTCTKNPILNIEFINLLCRLGVPYHFEVEIEEQLAHIFATLPTLFGEDDDHDHDLYTVSLLFRVLRQHGYKVPCDVFHKFKENDGFKKSIFDDTKGLLSLYEASYLSLHGEDIMDEALTFSRKKLEEALALQSCPGLEKQIRKALSIPFHLGVPRIEARAYILIYQEDESRNEMLLKFAKLDFNRVQLLHKQELSVLSRWWKDLNLMEKLPYLRDRIAEIYFWANGMHFEPQYEVSRIMVAKYTMMVSVMDDTYDAYATFEELMCFTEAIERCDMSVIDKLPAYMRVIYKALLDIFGETEKETSKHGRAYSAEYAKKEFIELAKAYHMEATWSNEGYVPSFEEYLQNGTISSSYGVFTGASFIGTPVAGIQEYRWLGTVPRIVKAGMLVGRLMNDIVGHEEEQKRGDCSTSVECYMKEHGVSKLEAVEEFQKICSGAWKDINEEYMRPTVIPRLLLKHIINLVRVTDVVYWLDDSYTNPLSSEDYIKSLFIDPLPE